MFATALALCPPETEAEWTVGDSAESRADRDGALAALSDEELEVTLCTHAAHLAVAECRFVLMVAEVDRRRIWVPQGARSCAHWLNWRCGVSVVTAREQVRVGHALVRLPCLRAAFGEGRVSYSKVRAITRIATPETEEMLVEMAGYATAAQLETIVRAYRRADPEEGRAALARHEHRYLRSYTDDDGMVVIHARLSPEDGAAVLAAIEGARRELAADRVGARSTDASAETSACRDTPSDTPAERAHDPYAASCADALVAVCESTLAGGLRDASAQPRSSVVVHVDHQVLGDVGAPGCAHAPGIGALSAHTVQRLACDASVSTLEFRPDGAVVPEGKSRQIPTRLRRAVLTRDGSCRWPGCTRHRYVDVHHVVFVSQGGRTVLSNLATLCRAHHRMVHEGGYRLTMDAAARVRVVSPDGTDLTALGFLPAVDVHSLAREHHRRGLRLDHTTMPTGGGPYDLDIAVDVLLYRAT